MPEIKSATNSVSSQVTSEAANLDGEQIIPLLSEQLVVTKRVVETGVVRLQKHLEERTETIEVPLTSVRYEVEHVPVNQVVSGPPGIRYEGDTTVYPVLGERLVVTKETVLLEEVRVTRVFVTTQETSTHVLQREQMSEERVATAPVCLA